MKENNIKYEEKDMQPIEEKKSNKFLIGIIALVIIVSIIVVGIVFITISINDDFVPYGGYNTSNDDLDFLEWSTDFFDDSSYYSEKLADSLNDENWYMVEYYAEKKADIISDAEYEITTFSLSNTYEELRTMFIELLSYDDSATYYLLKACDCVDDNDYTNAIDYLDLSTSYIKKATTQTREITYWIDNK